MSNGAPLRISAKKLPEDPKENLTWTPVWRVKAAPIFCMAAVRSEAAAIFSSWAGTDVTRSISRKKNASLRSDKAVTSVHRELMSPPAGHTALLIRQLCVGRQKTLPKLGNLNGTVAPALVNVKIYLVHGPLEIPEMERFHG